MKLTKRHIFILNQILHLIFKKFNITTETSQLKAARPQLMMYHGLKMPRAFFQFSNKN